MSPACPRRRRDRRHAGVPPPNSEACTAAVPVRRRPRTAMANSLLVCLVAAALAAVMAALPAAEARDTATMSGGYQHSCVVTADATVKCFGYNKNGELGLGDAETRGDESGEMGDLLPDVDLGTGAVAIAVSAGWQHTCALLEGGTVKCWGRNDWGQLGKGDFLDRGDDPATMGNNLTAVDLGTAPSGNGTAVAVAITTGQQFTCVLVEGGGVKCFGRNDEGQCGRGNLDTNVGSNGLEDMGDNLPYVDLGAGVEMISVSSGTASTCAALLGGGVKCWGGNSYGGLGVGDSYNVGDEEDDMGDNVQEVDLGTGETGYYVAYGLRHACAILMGGSVKCWGDNRSGQLGLGHVDTIGDDPFEMGDDLPYVDLGAGNTATSLSLGESHTCAILEDGSTRCWGKGFAGQLGRGEYYCRGKYVGEMGAGLAAVDLGTNTTASFLAAGADFTCAGLEDGSVKCWGLNELGALGLGDTDSRGDGADEMGDSLPAIDLGTGVTVASDIVVDDPATPAPTLAPTPSPTTQAPTPQATPQPSTQQPMGASPAPVASTLEPSSSVAAEPTVEPTAELTAEPTEEPTEEPTAAESTTEEPTPSPTSGSRGVDTVEAASEGGDEGGVFTTSNMTVTAYVAVPLLAFALLACFCARRRNREASGAGAGAGAGAGGARESWMKGGESAGGGGLGGHLDRPPAAVAGTAGGTAAGAGMRGHKHRRAAVRGGAGASFGSSGSQQGGPGARIFPASGSFSPHTASPVPHGGSGAVSDSSGPAGTGRSASPPGDEEDMIGPLDGHGGGGRRGSGVVDDDELSENGWGSYIGPADLHLPSYEDAQRR